MTSLLPLDASSFICKRVRHFAWVPLPLCSLPKHFYNTHAHRFPAALASRVHKSIVFKYTRRFMVSSSAQYYDGIDDIDDATVCVFDGVKYLDQEEWKPDSCTSCRCYLGNTVCDTEECPDLECRSQKYIPLGKCCPVCAEDEAVFGPEETVSPTTSLTNKLRFDMVRLNFYEKCVDLKWKDLENCS
ncbi:collagen alpha-1(II) chain [Caerostris extrusa]|uniref:Collagen alpha-1(II) chain n=1 Tax=Caerostris extrusa TaxID=172846 RepID=A0AAV4N067_CAEEX|nr:collagen alpha-1(II) chain [Caerostris extrusa]